MGNLNNPAAGFEVWIDLLFLDFFSTLLDVWNVVSLFDNVLGWFTRVTFVSAEMLFNAIGTFNDNFIQYELKLTGIMPVCSGYDYRQRDPTAVYQDMTLAAFFSPYLSGCGQQTPGQAGL